MSEREIMEYDVIIVGAGPAGLSCAIRLKQAKPDLMVAVIEKSSEIGAHILSGAVIEPEPLDQLLPGWRDDPPPRVIALIGGLAEVASDPDWVANTYGVTRFIRTGQVATQLSVVMEPAFTEVRGMAGPDDSRTDIVATEDRHLTNLLPS